ncbi:hypothetical protein GS439_21655 [Rhodococcus hoagii]|nr:hypothetical protein [Prescottella equi]NKW47572.1 hypothetical protein [Prescottella equi]
MNTTVARCPDTVVHVYINDVSRIRDRGGWRTQGRGSDHAKTVDRMMALVELRQTCSRTCSPEWLADEGGSPSMLMVSDHESATSRETRLLMLTRYDGLKIHALH